MRVSATALPNPLRAAERRAGVRSRVAVRAVAVPRDGHLALSGSTGGTLQLWDLAVGEVIQAFEAHADQVTALAWTTDQRRALSGSDDYTVRVWDVEMGRCLRVLEGHKAYVVSVAWSAGQRRGCRSRR